MSYLFGKHYSCGVFDPSVPRDQNFHIYSIPWPKSTPCGLLASLTYIFRAFKPPWRHNRTPKARIADIMSNMESGEADLKYIECDLYDYPSTIRNKHEGLPPINGELKAIINGHTLLLSAVESTPTGNGYEMVDKDVTYEYQLSGISTYPPETEEGHNAMICLQRLLHANQNPAFVREKVWFHPLSVTQGTNTHYKAEGGVILATKVTNQGGEHRFQDINASMIACGHATALDASESDCHLLSKYQRLGRDFPMAEV